jgi:hypothetical protein
LSEAKKKFRAQYISEERDRLIEVQHGDADMIHIARAGYS